MKRPADDVQEQNTKTKKVKVDQQPPSTDGWTKVEKRKKKKAGKAEARAESSVPRFMYSNHEIIKRSHAITIDDLRDLIMHIVADAPPPNWLRIDNAKMIERVVALLVPGLTPEILHLPPLPTSATANPNLPLSIPLLPPTSSTSDSVLDKSSAASIPFVASTFSHACPTRAPGDQYRMHSVLSSFFTGPVSGEEKKRRMTQRVQSEINKTDISQYLLTLEQMIENDYPIPSYMADVFEKPAGWVETPEPAKNEGKWKQTVYALDCEMCMTEDGKELTRVCIIDYHTGIVVYDKLVQPAKPIVDYLTRWSGITKEALEGVTTTHAEVQAHVLKLLTPGSAVGKTNPFSMPSPSASTTSTATTTTPASTTPAESVSLPTPILLGHSLESDLKSLRICHPRCIDTALLYHHPRGRPLKPGLAWLTKKWCSREIQTRGEGGHDPEEDARACLELLKRKLENGRGYGEYKVDWESVFERMGRCNTSSSFSGSGGGGKVRSAVVDHGNPSVMHGSKATTAIGCKTDEEVLEGLKNVIPSHQYVFGRFMGLANVLGWVTPKGEPATTTTSTGTGGAGAGMSEVLQPLPDPSLLNPALSALNSHLAAVHAALPPRTALVIFTGHSDPRRMAALGARKGAWEGLVRAGGLNGTTTTSASTNGVNPNGNGDEGAGEGKAEVRWTAQDARDLEEAVELTRRGLVFLGIKQ